MSEWSSPRLQQIAAEAVWDRQTYERLVAEWAFHALRKPTPGHVPSRARRDHGEQRIRVSL